MPRPSFVPKNTIYHTVNTSRDGSSSRLDYQHDNEAKGIPQQRMKGGGQDIAWYTFFLTVPMLLLTCVLFVFVFAYRVTSSKTQFEQLQGSQSSSDMSDNAYYVNLSSTFLIFIASWMSSLAPMLAGCAVALGAYPVAGRLYQDTIQHKTDKLLTPFQLSLTLRLITGSPWISIWKVVGYYLGWGRGTRDRGSSLTSLFSLTCIMVFLGTLVFGADTWLHITTKTVSVTQLSVLENTAAPYSLNLISPNCTSTNNTISEMSAANLTCTIDPASSLLTGGTSVLQTLNNQSNAISVLNDGPDSNLAYMTVTPSTRSSKDDFSAASFGVRTSCWPITASCNMSLPNAVGVFNCSGGNFFLTESQKSQFDWAIFNDEAMTDEAEGGVANNPFYYAVADVLAPSAQPLHNLANDSGVVLAEFIMGVVLECKVEVFDVVYDVVQGHVMNMTSTSSNNSVANVFVPAMIEASYGTATLQNAFAISAAEATSSQNLADMFSITLSKVALSVGAGSVVQMPASAAQLRDSILVAKVLKAPLYMLVICNLAFVVAGIVLAVAAVGTSAEAREVQARLSVAGIVAYMFDGEIARTAGIEESVAGKPEKLYTEFYDGQMVKKVGIGRTDNDGYDYRTLEPGRDGYRNSVIEVWGPVDGNGGRGRSNGSGYI